MLSDNIQDKIKNVYYTKKNKNYKNIPLFPTIDQTIIFNKPVLEGLDNIEVSDLIGDIGANEIAEGKQIVNAYADTLSSLFGTDVDVDMDIDGNVDTRGLTVIASGADKLKDMANDQYKKIDNEFQKLMKLGDSANKDPGDIAKSLVEAIKNNKDKKPGAPEPPGLLTEIILGIKGIFIFLLNFINNVFIYLSIVFAQIIYKDVPIQPFGNFYNPPTMFNWPWKLDLNVAPADNTAIDPSANLWDPEQGPAVGSDGKFIPGETYLQHQKILYDSNIIFNFFIQVVLVFFTWVFTNNIYYQIYNVVDTLSKIPYRYIQPSSNEDGMFIKRGLNILSFSIVNTIVSAPYDVLYIFLWFIKYILKLTGIYEFYPLSYIILFVIILYFTLKYFWGIYTSFVNDLFMQSNLGDIFKTYFFYFLIGIYGIYQHFFCINVVDGDNKPIAFDWKRLLALIVVICVIFVASPLIRFFFYFSFVFICFDFQGFTNDVYDSIIKYEKQQKCDSNKFSFSKTIRAAIYSFFEYFYYFVIFVLIISNFLYLNSRLRTYNKNSSSALKIMIGIIFLSIFMYLIYSLMNKNEPKRQQTVVYGDTFLNEKADLDGVIDNMNMPNFKKPVDNSDSDSESDNDSDSGNKTESESKNNKSGTIGNSMLMHAMNAFQNVQFGVNNDSGYGNINETEMANLTDEQKLANKVLRNTSNIMNVFKNLSNKSGIGEISKENLKNL